MNFKDKRLDNLDEKDMKKLRFKTLVECEVFYFTYTKAVGFGVRRETPQINHHGIVITLWFCCDFKGARFEKDKNHKDRKMMARNELKCFCKAFISFKYLKQATQKLSCSITTSEFDSSFHGNR